MIVLPSPHIHKQFMRTNIMLCAVILRPYCRALRGIKYYRVVEGIMREVEYMKL